jgi:predicted nucleotidyltransferase
MVSEKLINEIVTRVVEAANPTRVILFGSHARGDAGPDSDIDLLIIVAETGSRRELAIKTRTALREVKRPFDIIIAEEEDVRFYGDTPGTVLYPALREGVVVYG